MVKERDLEIKAQWIRQQILEMTYNAQKGHIGGSLSCVDILVDLFYRRMTPNDIFILSKGHACQTVYAILADKGYIPIDELKDFAKEGSRLCGHLSMEVPGVFVDSGSLGNGLGIACGVALADILDGKKRKIYVLIGDGELGEGSGWEAAMYIGTHSLRNIIPIVDCNGLSVLGEVLACTYEFVSLIPWAECPFTTKGNGISFMENKAEWHHGVPNKEEYEQARKELGY